MIDDMLVASSTFWDIKLSVRQWRNSSDLTLLAELQFQQLQKSSEQEVVKQGYCRVIRSKVQKWMENNLPVAFCGDILYLKYQHSGEDSPQVTNSVILLAETEPPPSSNQESTVEEPSPVLEEHPAKVRRAKSSRSQHRRPRGTRSSQRRRRPIASIDEEGPFSDKAVCTLFFRKLYLMSTLQLGLTLGIICTFVYWRYLKIWVRRRPWFCYTMLPLIMLLAITIACCDQARRRFPLDAIMLLIFTILEGMLLGSIAAFFDADALCGQLVPLPVCQNTANFVFSLGFLYGCLCAILQSMWLRIIHAAVGTIIFSIYLLVDTQLMLGKKDQDRLNPNEYIFAVLNIYIDIFSFFLFLLQFVGWRK
ncbi:LOW QUALITY PROTEIN: protein lifeguard 1-like [Lacerta agilis]|uniref:LOW QUALITY PROTEIN: protein lifeguard 1-like n=1 Tax=Lacerta agilis TaxID=80427 RepID=UPI001419E59D|nr:LOW QUALITY PROTEIN: protein lifeguard 1-like [Lacerta agilis]